MFDYLILNNEIDTPRRVVLFNAALKGSTSSITYTVEQDITDFVIANASDFELFQSETLPLNLSTTLLQLKVKFTSLTGFSREMIDMAIANNLYSINQENIEIAAKTEDLALDVIRGASETVFNYLATDLKAYLSSIASSPTTKYTINEAGNFASITHHIADSDPDHLDEVIRGASPNCTPEDLSNISNKAWPTLLDIGATRPSIANILSYYLLNEAGEIDEHLSNYLSREARIEMDSSEDAEELEKLAIAILSDERIASSTRSKLVADMHLQDYIVADAFPIQNGDLYGHLVNDRVIEDSAATYTHLKSTTIDTRLAYIIHAEKFTSYAGEVGLDSEEISAIASSKEVSPAIKTYLITNLTRFESQPSASSIQELAQFAAANNVSLNAATLHTIADGATPTDSIKLIAQSTEPLTSQDIISLLEEIGAGYEQLAQSGRRVSLDDTDPHATLVERLKTIGMVSSTSKRDTKKGHKLVVNMKKHFNSNNIA